MRHKAMTWLQGLVVVAFFAVSAAILFPNGSRSRENARRASCQSNLKQIGLAFAQYARDYEGKFPLTTTEQGWFGTVQPDVKSIALFACPSEKRRGADNLTDYWLNGRLAGVAVKKVANAKVTLLLGEGEASDDPNVSLQSLPPLWATKDDSPARRHLDGGNYLFVDGHVKSLKPGAITLEKPGKNQPTFLAR